MNTATRVTAARGARGALLAAALLTLAGALGSCSAPPDLGKAPESESAQRDEPAGGAAPPGEPAPMPDTASKPGEPDLYPSAPESESADASPPPDGEAMPESQNAPPLDSDDEAVGRIGSSKKAAKPRSYRYEAPAEESAPDATEAQPPPPMPAPAETAPAEPPASRGLAEAARPRAAAPPAGGAPAALPPPTTEAEKEFDVVPVFYGTDRGRAADPNRLHYGIERAERLELGRAMVTVPTVHKVPNIERPWVVEIPYFKVKVWEQKEDPAKHFTVQDIGAMPEEQLLALVKERLGKSATFKDHAFVFVHGFNTSFDNALYRTAQIAYDLKFDGAPFVYSWPSGGNVSSYTYDRGSAEGAEPYLEEFLKLVVEKSGAKSISLIAHSMGNELLLRVLERRRPVVPDGVTISQVILAAPDVDRNKFKNIAQQITTFAKGVTLYAASNDRALYYSGQFWRVPRAGDVPESGPMIVKDVDTIDVTSVSTDGLGLNHSGYAENPELLNDVKALLLEGVRPPDKRIKNVLTVESPAGVFWRYPPAAPR